MADVAAVLEDYDDMDQGEEGDIVLEVSADGEAMEDGELTEPEEAVKVLVCLVLFFYQELTYSLPAHFSSVFYFIERKTPPTRILSDPFRFAVPRSEIFPHGSGSDLLPWNNWSCTYTYG
jgi:hypothetical protein